jgi:hypothetical protein
VTKGALSADLPSAGLGASLSLSLSLSHTLADLPTAGQGTILVGVLAPRLMLSAPQGSNDVGVVLGALLATYPVTKRVSRIDAPLPIAAHCRPICLVISTCTTSVKQRNETHVEVDSRRVTILRKRNFT